MRRARFSKSVYDEAFVCDGGNRDLYIRSTSLNEWQGFLKFIGSTRYRFSFQIDGTPARLPSDATLLFSANTRPLLQIHFAGITLNCHFFLEDEIELDLDPRELTDDADGARADAILMFMAELGEALKKPVLMTAENAPDAVMFRYDPATQQITYEPPTVRNCQ